MRIAVITNAYPPRARGGAGRIAEMQVQMLQAAGEEVRVWCPEILWFADPAPVRLLRHFQDLGARQEVAQDVLAWQPHVLLTHNLTGCGFSTARAIQKRGVRWVHLLHDVQLFEPSGQLINAQQITTWQLFWTALRKLAFGNPDLVISPTLWLLRRHRHRGLFWPHHTQTEVLPNPSLPFQRRQVSMHQPLRLLYVGRVSSEKGSELLMRLLPKIPFPFEFHVIGEGPDIPRLQQAFPAAQIHGELPRAEVLEQMAQADVLLVPSRIEENQPTVILEAASVGLPVIGSNQGGIPETLGRLGLVCPSMDVGAWVRTLEQLRTPFFFGGQVSHMEDIAHEHDPEMYRQRLLSLVRSKR